MASTVAIMMHRSSTVVLPTVGFGPRHSDYSYGYNKRNRSQSKRNSNRARWFLNKLGMNRHETYSEQGSDFEFDECTAVRPASIERLCERSCFTKRELQVMYRGFKQICPNGIVTLNRFKEIYAMIFPHGTCHRYAELVFRSVDNDSNGCITFEELIVSLTLLLRGTNEEKLEWIFDFYDVKRDGRITTAQLYDVLSAMHDLMGKHGDPPVTEFLLQQHIKTVFSELPFDVDGGVSRADFVDACARKPQILQSLAMFDTKL